MEGMPSQMMMTFCLFPARTGGRNSATISFLNRALNIGVACTRKTFSRSRASGWGLLQLGAPPWNLQSRRHWTRRACRIDFGASVQAEITGPAVDHCLPLATRVAAIDHHVFAALLAAFPRGRGDEHLAAAGLKSQVRTHHDFQRLKFHVPQAALKQVNKELANCRGPSHRRIVRTKDNTVGGV